ncbi:putative CDP alcohol phosphatidyltransferase [Trypanosoma vivax]|uniref:CDP-diacylglycerol--inositol 3-phosphatidyltransferase n=1 Tax=Trypanosoma vivax (strain Y486) TaxID=1055687 RepID=G0U3V7_TRYVY|nr:putative phosphatidyltransferase [Trypanosoma vivax]KAH8618704.1 putative CDP alcohol phosphatidyltransferase [Trypanosoma vivax]CCC50197.1 putative phosphatidyltransferase [Trypanosoma vivax Y486]
MANDNRGVTPQQIYFFYPNLIGYVRVIFTLASFCVCGHFPSLFIALYVSGFVLDAADGIVARRYGQCTRFGAILDMLTDRASTVGLLIVLVQALQPIPGWGATIFACLGFLDVASHFCRMYVSLHAGCSSHKDVDAKTFALLRLYYTNRTVMAVLCVGQEIFYILLYASAAFGSGMLLWSFLIVTGASNALKQVVNVQQLIDGMCQLAIMDAAERAKR